MEIQGEKTGLYLAGLPVRVDACNIFITQPKIKDIVAHGEDDFLVATNLLSHPENITKQLREGNPLLDQYSDFQLLLVTLQEKSEIQTLILKLFELIFPDYSVKIEETSINFNVPQNEREVTVGMINPFNFDDFSKMISVLFEPLAFSLNKDPEYNPANEAASAIAEKLRKGREKSRQMKAKADGDDVPQSLYARYTSVLSIGMHMDINIFFNYTPFQLYDSFNRYFAKIPCDTYDKLCTTPLMDMSKTDPPDEWTRNLYK